jgi:hypothetical protein
MKETFERWAVLIRRNKRAGGGCFLACGDSDTPVKLFRYQREAVQYKYQLRDVGGIAENRMKAVRVKATYEFDL